MIFNKYEWKLIVRVVLLFATLTAFAFLVMSKRFSYLIIVVPLIIFQLFEIFRFLKKTQDEVSDFVQSVHYRDFSRHFDVSHAPSELQPLRKGFNEINSAIKVISRERETQYQYLQKILELVDTGILSYETGTGNIAWMNESLKKMLQIPYLKTLDSLSKRDQDLYEEIRSIKAGENKVVTINRDKHSLRTLLSATAFQTDGMMYKLIAFQNVHEALDENESQAWKKLLSVMTHEIMNSVAPISSLADTLKNRLKKASEEKEDVGTSMEDIELGINTIKRRSEGLLKFAETYRNLNKVTNPNLKPIPVMDLFENLHHLMEPTLEQKKIEMEVVMKDPGLIVDADLNLIEQVMINLIVNAIDAVKENENPRIILSAEKVKGSKTEIRVADNGYGMSAEVMENIFVPFFSTKKSGSGIGLSLCKQIMMLHKGNIQVQSREGEGSVFTLQFS
ncbi:MAG TPA: HAMP domain-containing sensor histidine kinase [Chitinophagaceae bacterium]|nr:HAMP domain-containing sensor histidine kinase [Chitinophagaceae bacterium]